MSNWRKDEEAIWHLINDARQRMTLPQKRLWDVVSVLPSKWSYRPKPSLRSKAWVVAIIGNRVIWYDDYFNEMYDGFCISKYGRVGEITPDGEVGAELEEVVGSLLVKITDSVFG